MLKSSLLFDLLIHGKPLCKAISQMQSSIKTSIAFFARNVVGREMVSF